MTEVGAECSSARTCREGNTCAFAAPDSGISFQCQADRTATQVCNPQLGNPVCANAGQYVCTGNCTPRGIEGQTCSAKEACRSGFVCDNGLCRKGNVDVAIGAPCKASADTCVAGATCSKYDSATKSYSCVAKAKLDESCGNGVARCTAPLVCDSATFLCRAPSTLACP